ncbi:hypothetical protein A4U53_031060 [Rhizobium ruizarguesonis]|uniref:Uncharacterized protein n=2 Tax=Rhizobium TaxID=379 RepID=A0A179BV94_RHILE|nr:hypothetical protein [Rhizobium leguminosarum]OAP95143.1 hypothetical protein A4U53_18145 [Rhizobium leguminosarum]
MSCAECDCISVGDVVQHKMNTNVFGVVIAIGGSLIYIRVSPSLAVLSFHEWELEIVEDDEVPPAGAEQPVDDNVIQVDFTKRRVFTPGTPTEGAA